MSDAVHAVRVAASVDTVVLGPCDRRRVDGARTIGAMTEAKPIVGYCEPLSVLPGERVQFMISCEDEGGFDASLVALRSGGRNTNVPDTTPVPSSIDGHYEGRRQLVAAGSYAEFGPAPVLDDLSSFSVRVDLFPTALEAPRPQTVMATWDEDAGSGFWFGLNDHGVPTIEIADGEGRELRVEASRPLSERRWYRIGFSYDPELGVIVVSSLPIGPGFGEPSTADVVRFAMAQAPSAAIAGRRLLLAAVPGGERGTTRHLDGKIDSPALALAAVDEQVLAGTDVSGFDLRWDLGADIESRRIRDLGPHALHGETVQLPARGVTGSCWSGRTQRWSDAPDEYSAIHFHHDDVYDAGWEPDLELMVPEELSSGVYAMELKSATGVDHVPFYVRAPVGRRAKVAYLASTATYLAYANHRMTVAPDEIGAIGRREHLLPEQEWMLDQPVGLSQYEYHPDGSGVLYSSRRRPILNHKPYVELWTFTADLNVVAWLEQSTHDYDVVTDEDLHRDGAAALEGYSTVVTGAHPEYWSTAMLDTLEHYLENGGRMMYLGGNGFYWRVAFSDAWPGAMEVRRAEDGTRAWIAEPGEYYHSFTGEYGGLWRRLGRPPNRICGVGFAAQGFARASAYDLTDQARDPAVSWVFDGVDPEQNTIGNHGAGGGASGQEIDRYDTRLGSPPNAWVIATAPNQDPTMLRTKEEFHATMEYRPHADIRSDVVLFGIAGGGAVFSVGSIAWPAALGADGYRNDIATVTTNVLDRFVADDDLGLLSEGSGRSAADSLAQQIAQRGGGS